MFLTFWKGRIFASACGRRKLEEYLSLEDVKGIKDINNNDNDDDYVNKVIIKDRNNYDENDNKSISALRLDKDLVFSQGHHGYQWRWQR